MPSKLVTDRQKSATAVIAAARAHGSLVGPALDAFFDDDIFDGQPLPDTSMLMTALGRQLDRLTQAMIDADEARERELADDDAPRRRRDTLAEELYAALIELRSVAEGLLGPASSEPPRRLGDRARAHLGDRLHMHGTGLLDIEAAAQRRSSAHVGSPR